MRIVIDILDIPDDELLAKLDAIRQIFPWEQIMTELRNLQQQVNSNTDVVDSAALLIQGLKQKLDEAIASGNAEQEIQALSDALGTNHQELARAITANTPAAAHAKSK